MKRSLSILAFASTLILTGCGGAADSDNATDAGSDATAPQIPELTGEWLQSNSESEEAFISATITDDTVSVDWTMTATDDMAILDDDGDGFISFVYWEGSFTAPTDATEPYSWTSQADASVLDTALLGSMDDSKDFTYEEGVLHFTGMFQGEVFEAELEQDSTGSAEIEPAAEHDASSDEVESLPFNDNGWLGGDASPKLDDGESGELSVVEVGRLDADAGMMAFAFRNNTPAALADIDWTVVVRADGELVGSATSMGSVPSIVEPGAVGLAHLYFDSADSIPEHAEYKFEPVSSLASLPHQYAPMTVIEANKVGDAIVGSAINETGNPIGGYPGVQIYCFDGDKLVTAQEGAIDRERPIDDGTTVTFSEGLYGQNCPTFAVGVSGWYQ